MRRLNRNHFAQPELRRIGVDRLRTFAVHLSGRFPRWKGADKTCYTPVSDNPEIPIRRFFDDRLKESAQDRPGLNRRKIVETKELYRTEITRQHSWHLLSFAKRF